MIQGNAAQPKVSIVVPVYNSKQYLARCLDSLLGQTVSEIEVVLVDDGSTDGSSLTCDGWADLDSRIRVIHKENGGLSDARNCGALAARAPYIAFVDSDDSVDLDFCESLLHDIEATGADIATCDVVDVEDGCELPDHIDASHRTVEVVTPVEALRASITSGLPRIWVPTRLYKKELFNNGFLFPVGKTYEDAATIVEIFGSASSISVSNAQLYHYRHRAGSITTQPYTPKAHDIIDAWEHTASMACKMYPELKEDLDFRLYWARCVVLDRMIASREMNGTPEEKELVSYIRAHFESVKNNKQMTKARFVLSKVLMLSLPLYRCVLRVMK